MSRIIPAVGREKQVTPEQPVMCEHEWESQTYYLVHVVASRNYGDKLNTRGRAVRVCRKCKGVFAE